MGISNKLAALVAAFALLASPMFGAEAEAKVKTYHHHRHLRHFVKKPSLHGYRVSPDGDLIDSQGWRKRSSGWDNTCFNMDYMSSMYACGSANGRR
jgi:hypothetical protein